MQDLRAAAAAWRLDPSVTFLNHGSFGACPGPVLDAQSAWRDRMEADPVAFLERDIDGLLAAARSSVASFLHADPDGLAFVPNATWGIGAVLSSIDWRPGDQVVTTDHAYPAVLNALGRLCERADATLRVAAVPLPLQDPQHVVDAIVSHITDATRLVVADHITSPTAAIFPAQSIVEACRSRGVEVLIDAAHGPGMVDVDVDALGADYWCGNLHKWVCAPKGAAAVWVAPRHRDRVRPPVISHEHLRTFHAAFEWTGTHDPTAVLSAPAAIRFFDAIGWDAVRAHNNDLAEHGRAIVAAVAGIGAVGAGRIVAPAMQAAMSVVPLPGGVAATRDRALALSRRIFDDAKIEVPVSAWNGRGLIRLSAMLYNRPADYERLAGTLKSLL